ncbi:unnamed protein product, partial [Callosobruchus maculatus]
MVLVLHPSATHSARIASHLEVALHWGDFWQNIRDSFFFYCAASFQWMEQRRSPRSVPKTYPTYVHLLPLCMKKEKSETSSIPRDVWAGEITLRTVE